MDHLCACPICDALHRRPPLGRGEKAICVRCGTVVARRHRLAPDQVLALVVAAMMVFAIANAFPIVNLRVQGLYSATTLWGAVAALWSEGRQGMALLVFATTQAFPLLDLCCTLALLWAARNRERPRWFAPLLRLLQQVRPWGMVEVFMLGVVVSLVKLSGMAAMVPGVALWAFAALTVLMAAILSFHPHQLWHEPADG